MYKINQKLKLANIAILAAFAAKNKSVKEIREKESELLKEQLEAEKAAADLAIARKRERAAEQAASKNRKAWLVRAKELEKYTVYHACISGHVYAMYFIPEMGKHIITLSTEKEYIIITHEGHLLEKSDGSFDSDKMQAKLKDTYMKYVREAGQERLRSKREMGKPSRINAFVQASNIPKDIFDIFVEELNSNIPETVTEKTEA